MFTVWSIRSQDAMWQKAVLGYLLTRILLLKSYLQNYIPLILLNLLVWKGMRLDKSYLESSLTSLFVAGLFCSFPNLRRFGGWFDETFLSCRFMFNKLLQLSSTSQRALYHFHLFTDVT